MEACRKATHNKIPREPQLVYRNKRALPTNSVSSGNIVEESFFDKYFAEKLKVPTII
jgi:hypothetical protein